MPSSTTADRPPDQAAPTTTSNRFYLARCETFDRISFTAEAGVLRHLSFAVSADRSVKAGLDLARSSPFQTVFVIDEATGRALFALTQNVAFEAEARKKKPKGDPPPTPPVDPECCQAAGCVPPLACIVDANTCWCIQIGGAEPAAWRKVPAHKVAPFRASDPLRSMLTIIDR